MNSYVRAVLIGGLWGTVLAAIGVPFGFNWLIAAAAGNIIWLFLAGSRSTS